jgi:putative drug exporter of the RND superfamily
VSGPLRGRAKRTVWGLTIAAAAWIAYARRGRPAARPATPSAGASRSLQLGPSVRASPTRHLTVPEQPAPVRRLMPTPSPARAGKPALPEAVAWRPARPLTDGIFATLARWVVRFRALVIVFWLVVAAVLTATLPSLGSEINNDNSAFLPASAASTKAGSLGAPVLGTEGRSSQIVIVAARSSQLTRADQAVIAREIAAASKVPHVTSVRALGVSSDGDAVELRVRVDVNRHQISAQRTIVSDLEATFHQVAVTAGLELHLAGQVAIAVANQTSSNRSSRTVQKFSILFILVLLIVVFRSPIAALVTLLPSVLALLISTRLIGELGAHGLKVSAITQVLLITLLLGAGTDYGLFLVFRVREELRDGYDGDEAVRRAVVRVAESISASAGTVILALLTLLLATFGLYHDLGLPLAIGMTVILVLGLTLLPALLAAFGPAVFWPARIAPGPPREGRWAAVAVALVRRPALTLGLGVAVFLGLAGGALGYKAGGFGGATTAPAGSDAAAGSAALVRHFPQSSSNPANLVFGYQRPVWEQPELLARAFSALRASGRFTALAGALDANGRSLSPSQFAQLYAALGPPGRLPVVQPPSARVAGGEYDAYRAAAEFLAPDGRIVQFEATLAAGAQNSAQAMNATPEIRAVVAQAAASSGAIASGVAGQAATSHDVSSTAGHDLRLIIPIAVLAIGMLLALVLRSLVAPLYLIVSVVLSYLAALGLATILFIDLRGDSGISFFLPFLMFVFLLALGEDYNILVMTRIHEEAKRLPLHDAVVRAVARTGSTITSAGVVLGGTFLVLGFAGTGPNKSEFQAIGFGLAFGILLDTFLVRTLLVPSAVILLGRWNWWPARLSAGPSASRGYRTDAIRDPG